MKRFTILISIILLSYIFSAGVINASEEPENNCVIELVNNTDKYYMFWLEWIDHPYLHQTKGKPWAKAGAEIAPGKSFLAGSNHTPGLYTIICKERWKPKAMKIIRNFTVLSETKEIIITVVTVLPMNIPIITLDFTPKRKIEFRPENHT